jgi:hypothetical protein
MNFSLRLFLSTNQNQKSGEAKPNTSKTSSNQKGRQSNDRMLAITKASLVVPGGEGGEGEGESKEAFHEAF